MAMAKWEDGGIPQAKEYDSEAPDKLPPFPESLESMAAVEAGLLKALDDAFRSAAPMATRYAVDHIQLRGSSGQIVATDGRELLVQSGFALPFSEDVLVLSTAVFSCRELATDAEVTIGKTATHICLRVGAWTFHLPIDKESRFPKVEDVIPSLSRALTRCHLDPADVAFAAKALPKLPGGDDDNAPITVDLNGQAIIRARGSGQSRITELVLARSEISGPPLRFCLNRQFLARALHLGFAELALVKEDVPLLFHDETRQFVIMPLAKDLALAPTTDSVRIPSSDASAVTQSPTHERRQPVMKSQPIANATNGNANGSHEANGSADGSADGKASGITALISEAEALKTMLRDAYARTNRLLVTIKRHRKQADAVRTTLASLRQLQHIDA
jgi:hypothetical protein